MRKIKLIFALLSFMLCICANAGIIKSGSCGENVTYTLDDSGLLVIEGSGEMTNYTYSINAPWYSHVSSIKQVEIRNGVTSIGDKAFWDCSGITSLTIPNSVTNIGSYAFAKCSSLTSLNVESGNTKYDSRDNCNAIIETETNTLIVGCCNTVIPNSVKRIEGFAFSGCSGLISLTIPNSVKSIGELAFWECSSLTSLTIPNSVTSIESSAFASCSSLTSLTIPNSVTSIESTVFASCSSLTSLTIPNSVTSIGDNAFSYCSGLTSLTLPNSVTSIKNEAFSYCSGLTSLTIPNSVTSIGSYAFTHCSGLTSVTLGNSVTNIGSSAFSGCSSISTFYCNATTPPTVSSDSFEGMNYNHTILYVPKGAKSSYAFSDYWKNFLNIVEMEDSEDDGKEYLVITKKDGEVIKIAMDDVLNVSPKQVEIVEVKKIVEVTVYVYDDSRSEILLPSGETIVLTITDGIVNIEDAPMNELITIYTIEGELYEATRVNERITSFNLPRNSIYIIKVGEKTFKVKI